MAESTPAAVDNNRRIKIACIPMLALILLWVLFGQSDEAGSSTAETATTNSIATQSVTAVEFPATDSDRMVRPRRAVVEARRPWPQIPLEETLLHNPFAPTAFRESSDNAQLQTDGAAPQLDPQARLKKLAAALQQDGLSILFETAEGKTAVIGSRVIHEGDMLDETTRVVEIRSDGLVLEHLQP